MTYHTISALYPDTLILPGPLADDDAGNANAILAAAAEGDGEMYSIYIYTLQHLPLFRYLPFSVLLFLLQTQLI